MRFWKILWGEMRRYWRPFTLIVMAVMLLMWNVIFEKDRVSVRPGTNGGIAYDISVEYAKRFGANIDPEERAAVEADYEKALAALNEQYEIHMGQYDIHSVDDYHLLSGAVFLAEQQDYEDENYRMAADRWGADNLVELEKTCDDIFWHEMSFEYTGRMHDLESLVSSFQYTDEMAQFAESLPTLDPSALEKDSREEYLWYELSDEAKTRLRQSTAASEGRVSLLEVYNAHEGFQYLYQSWAVLIFILCGLIVLPLPVGNRITGVTAMQFSSRTGRRVIHAQLGGALVNTLLINGVIDAFFIWIWFFGNRNTRHLLHCHIGWGGEPLIKWLDLTYMQFVLLTFGKVLLLSLGLTGVLFVLSHLSKNYLPALTLSVPAVFLLVKISNETDYMLKISHSPSFAYPLTLMICVVVAVVAEFAFMKRTRKADYAD